MEQFYGCLPSKVDLRDYKICAAGAPQHFPDSFELLYLPKVKNQGSVSSCVAHVTAEIVEYFDKNEH